MQPSEGEIARFYALYSLFCKITEGDIQIETKQGIRPITHDELSAYVGNKEAFPSLIPVIPAEFPGKVSTEIPLEERHEKDDPKTGIIRWSSSHCCLQYPHSAQCTSCGPIYSSKAFRITDSMTYDELIIWCGKHPAAYKILPNQQGHRLSQQERGPYADSS